MDHKKAGTVSNILIGLAVLLSLLLFLFDEINTVFVIIVIVAAVLLICAVVIKLKYYRCPHCHDWLPFRSKPGVYCKYCGKKL